MLKINGERSRVKDNDIIRIEPNCITWKIDKQTATEFRTHWKFSKRIYYSLEPIWWLLHCWDFLLADKWLPQLSFGFGTLTVSPDADPETATCDGYTVDGWIVTWPEKIARLGTSANSSGTSIYAARITAATTTQDNWSWLYRSMFLFDTSSLPDDASICFALLVIYAASSGLDDLNINPKYGVYSSDPISNTNLVAADFTRYGTTLLSNEKLTKTEYWSTYGNWTLNSDGLAAISKMGITKLAIRETEYDAGGATPTWTSGKSSYITAYTSESNTHDPYLYVIYDESVSQSLFIGLGE